MLAVVKKHHTKEALFEIEGDIPKSVINYFTKTFGDSFEIIDKDETIDIMETEWFRKRNEKITPGDALKIYRTNAGLTQKALGERLGKFSKQGISDMENNRRAISKETAKTLSKIFNVPVSRFI